MQILFVSSEKLLKFDNVHGHAFYVHNSLDVPRLNGTRFNGLINIDVLRGMEKTPRFHIAYSPPLSFGFNCRLVRSLTSLGVNNLIIVDTYNLVYYLFVVGNAGHSWFFHRPAIHFCKDGRKFSGAVSRKDVIIFRIY